MTGFGKIMDGKGQMEWTKAHFDFTGLGKGLSIVSVAASSADICKAHKLIRAESLGRWNSAAAASPIATATNSRGCPLCAVIRLPNMPAHILPDWRTSGASDGAEPIRCFSAKVANAATHARSLYCAAVRAEGGVAASAIARNIIFPN